MTRMTRFFLLFCILLLSAGCAKPTVVVDAMGEAHKERRYIVTPGMPNVRADDLLFVVYREHVARLMTGLGYTVVRTDKEANAAVLLSYGVRGEPTPQYYEEEPRVGLGFGYGSGYGPRYGYGGGSFMGMGVGLSQPYSGGGYSRARYLRQITLDAVALGASKDPFDQKSVSSLWKVILESEGKVEDLRSLFPRMLQAGRPYIGRNTDGPVTLPLEDE